MALWYLRVDPMKQPILEATNEQKSAKAPVLGTEVTVAISYQ